MSVSISVWGRRIDVRHGRVHQVQVTNQVGRNRVRERTDTLLARGSVGEHREFSVEEVVGLADWYADRKPVTSRRDRHCLKAVLVEPSIYSRHRFCLGCSVRLNL